MQKTIAIIGNGYVGKAANAFFSRKYLTVIYDPPQGLTDADAVNAADLAVICVPTPMLEDGSVDLAHLHETFKWLSAPLILIKSTVPPGTTRALAEKHGFESRIAFSPEYIGEGNYHIPYWKGYPHPTDMALHEFFIFGGDRSATSKIIEFFSPIAGAHAKYVQTDSTTAELAKYMENSYLAMKVTFANEFYGIASAFGVDYGELRELFLLDKRVDASHTLVFPESRGFGGKCLPKDVNGIADASSRAGYEPHFIRSILENNSRFRNKNG